MRRRREVSGVHITGQRCKRPAGLRGEKRLGLSNSYGLNMNHLGRAWHSWGWPFTFHSLEAAQPLHPQAWRKLPDLGPALHQAHRVCDACGVCLTSRWLPFSALVTPCFSLMSSLTLPLGLTKSLISPFTQEHEHARFLPQDVCI